MNAVRKTKLTPYAVVVGLDHIVGLQTARILAARRVPVVGVVRNAKHFCSQTNVCEKILVAECLSDDVIGALISFGQQLDQKAVLVPCRDMSVLSIARHRAALEPYYHVNLPQLEVVNMLMDKSLFYKYALKNNLPIPKTFLLHSREDAEKAAERLSFPCIMKPGMKTATWEVHTRRKCHTVSDKKEFLNIYDQGSGWTDILVAQEWITGPDNNLYSCNMYLNENSEPLVAFTSRKIRQYPPRTGETSLGIECENEFVSTEAIRLFMKVRFQGLAYLEMKRDELSGRYYIIEANVGRPTGRSALAEACGVELVYTMYCDSIGRSLPGKGEQKYFGVKWIHLGADLVSAISYWMRGDLTIKEWWQSLRGRKHYAVLSWSDPLPFVAEIQMGIIHTLRIIMSRVVRMRMGVGLKDAVNKGIGGVQASKE